MEHKNLKPAGVFRYFEEICQVPRPSKKEEKIIAYLQDFGKKQGLETLTDEAGNILMRKPATHGMENCKTVALQAHMDMVCEKNNDVHHDFLTDPIATIVDGEWMKAKGTTLGADNGIGVATALAVLADESLTPACGYSPEFGFGRRRRVVYRLCRRRGFCRRIFLSGGGRS